VPPKSKPLGLGVQVSGRAMAVPKTRRKRMEGWEQENLMDFEEAEFLDYRNLGDEDGGVDAV